MVTPPTLRPSKALPYIERDSRFSAIETERDRENLFEDYMVDLDRKRKVAPYPDTSLALLAPQLESPSAPSMDPEPSLKPLKTGSIPLCACMCPNRNPIWAANPPTFLVYFPKSVVCPLSLPFFLAGAFCCQIPVWAGASRITSAPVIGTMTAKESA